MQPRPNALLNPFVILSMVFVGMSCLSLLCVATVFVNPSVLPASLQVQAVAGGGQLPEVATRIPTATATETSMFPTLPPTWTKTNTPLPSDTPLPSKTLTPTETWTPRPPTATETPTETSTVSPSASRTPSPTRSPSPTGPTRTPSKTPSKFKYTVKAGYPQYTNNFANTAGCNWMGFAGQVFGLDGKAQIGLLVHLEGGGINLDALTGSGPAAYGTGSYEFGGIASAPQETTDTYRLQVRDISGAPLSDNIIVPTVGTCARNLILVHFEQNH